MPYHQPTAAQFNEAILNKWIIRVYQDGEVIEDGGIIDFQTKEAIRINGYYFKKSSCQFVVRHSQKIQLK
ncbi:hypothetical protein [Paenibacillus humicus]|uniref:hypothetical protein n=1 Tax=Paenibacillus humicus TaxID=412861 RepID=UPI003F16C779